MPVTIINFSPADIDDVVLPPSDRLARSAVLALFLVGIALTGYIITDGLKDSDVEADEPEIAKAGSESPMHPPAQHEAVDIQPEEKTQGTALSRAMQEGRAAKNQQLWDDAQDSFHRALEIEPQHAEARKEAEAMGDELRNQAKFKKFNEHIERKKYRQALRLAQNFDKASYYYPQVEKEADNARRIFVTKVRSDIETHIDKSAFRKARQRLRPLPGLGISQDEIDTLSALIQTAEQTYRAEAEARDAQALAVRQTSGNRTLKLAPLAEPTPVVKKPTAKKSAPRNSTRADTKRSGPGCESKVMTLQRAKMAGTARSYPKDLLRLSAQCRTHKKTQKIACNFFMKRPGNKYEKPCKRLGVLLKSTSQKNALKQKIRRMRRNANGR